MLFFFLHKTSVFFIWRTNLKWTLPWQQILHWQNSLGIPVSSGHYHGNVFCINGFLITAVLVPPSICQIKTPSSFISCGTVFPRWRRIGVIFTDSYIHVCMHTRLCAWFRLLEKCSGRGGFLLGQPQTAYVVRLDLFAALRTSGLWSLCPQSSQDIKNACQAHFSKRRPASAYGYGGWTVCLQR